MLNVCESQQSKWENDSTLHFLVPILSPNSTCLATTCYLLANAFLAPEDLSRTTVSKGMSRSVSKTVFFCQIFSYPHCVFSFFFIFRARTPRTQNTKLLQAITITSLYAALDQAWHVTLWLDMTSPVVASRVELGPYLLHSLFVHSPVLPPLPFIFPYHWPFPLLIVGGLLYAQPQLKSNLVHFKTKEIYPFCNALNGTYSNLQKSKLLTKPPNSKTNVTIILRSCSQRPRFEIRAFAGFARKSSLFAIQFQLAYEFLQFVVALVRRSECQDREVGHLVAIHDSGTAEAVHRVLQGVGGRTFRCHQHRSKIKNGDRQRPQFESGTYATVDTRRGLYRWGAAGAYSGFCVRGAPPFPFPSCPLPLSLPLSSFPLRSSVP